MFLSDQATSHPECYFNMDSKIEYTGDEVADQAEDQAASKNIISLLDVFRIRRIFKKVLQAMHRIQKEADVSFHMRGIEIDNDDH